METLRRWRISQELNSKSSGLSQENTRTPANFFPDKPTASKRRVPDNPNNYNNNVLNLPIQKPVEVKKIQNEEDCAYSLMNSTKVNLILKIEVNSKHFCRKFNDVLYRRCIKS